MRIGLDVDGVMYQFQKTACYMLNSIKGYNLDVENWTHWNWPKDHVSKEDWNWLWNTGVRLGLFRYGHLYKGTIEAVRKLADCGFENVIITSRPRHAVQDTLDWISYLRLPFREVHILSDGELKSTVKCDLYVDDKPENILDFLENTTGKPLLWTRPWNANYERWRPGIDYFANDDRAHRVESWEEVLSIAGQLYGQRLGETRIVR